MSASPGMKRMETLLVFSFWYRAVARFCASLCAMVLAAFPSVVVR
nr:MAG TPA: hypothetical protein [Caudoviricetes sp.]